MLKLDGTLHALAVPGVPEADRDCDREPDKAARKIEEGVCGLVGKTPARAGWPEDEEGSAAQVALRDKAEVAAICAHGVVVA